MASDFQKFAKFPNWVLHWPIFAKFDQTEISPWPSGHSISSNLAVWEACTTDFGKWLPPERVVREGSILSSAEISRWTTTLLTEPERSLNWWRSPALPLPHEFAWIRWKSFWSWFHAGFPWVSCFRDFCNCKIWLWQSLRAWGWRGAGFWSSDVGACGRSWSRSAWRDGWRQCPPKFDKFVGRSLKFGCPTWRKWSRESIGKFKRVYINWHTLLRIMRNIVVPEDSWGRAMSRRADLLIEFQVCVVVGNLFKLLKLG